MDVDLDRCLNGDKQAWDAFVERWSAVIYAAVYRASRGRRASEIEDHAQDVFVRLVKDDFRLLRTFDPERASLSTWLTLVARSTTIDKHRRKRHDTVPLNPEHLPEPGPPASVPVGPEIPLHLLSGRQRLVLAMLFDDDMSVAEVGRMLGVDDQTVRSTKHKALSRLRELLAEAAPEKGQEPIPEGME